jgi:hypothetical protein
MHELMTLLKSAASLWVALSVIHLILITYP